MLGVRYRLGLQGFFWVSSLVIVSGVALVQRPAQGSTPRLRVVHAMPSSGQGECAQCHQDVSHPVSQGILARECLMCHTTGLSGSVPDRLQKVAQHKPRIKGPVQAEQPPGETPLPMTPSLPKAEGQGPGMHVTLYYQQTRIGAVPNEMILIPAGAFIRGTDQRMSDEGPQHNVTLGDFYIDKYEVTNLQYQQFIDATHRKSPDHFENRTFPEGKADHPVTFVSWHDAQAYCAWAGKRLPSDQEWEKAARGTDGRTYPWGNVFDINKVNSPVRWKTLKLEGDTTPVGAFDEGVSPYGVHDMSGNVWEWTDSWYVAYPGNSKMTENYGEKYKTLKGGSWWDCSFYKCGISAPVYNRAFFLRNTKNKSFGFRCAKDVERASVILKRRGMS